MISIVTLMKIKFFHLFIKNKNKVYVKSCENSLFDKTNLLIMEKSFEKSSSCFYSLTSLSFLTYFGES